MTFTLLNPNVTDFNLSSDAVQQAILQTACNLVLVRDSSKLVTACKARGLTVIFRSTNDGSISSDPAAFVDALVTAAPDADAYYCWNEVGLPDVLEQVTLTAMARAEARGKKIVGYNVQTNQAVSAWQKHQSTILTLTQRGHFVGAHLYLDGEADHDAGGYAPLDWLKSIGAACLVTEYAPIQSILNANKGWRAFMTPTQFNAWQDSHAAKMQAYNFPCLHFSIDPWPLGNGSSSGFGTLDHPEIQEHMLIVNANHPLAATTTPTYPTGSSPAPKVVTVAGGLNLRATPAISTTAIRVMANGETITVFAQPVITTNGFNWQRVTDKLGNQGWAANTINGVASWADPPEAETNRVVIPNMPFSSEFNWRAGYTALCGQTSLYMLMEYNRQLDKVTLPTEITPLSIALYLGKGPKDLTGLDELQKASRAYLPEMTLATATKGSEFDLIKTNIDVQKPLIALVWYDLLPTRWDKEYEGSHILVINGYSDQSVVTHDPDSNGNAGSYISYARAQFMEAWITAGATALVLA